MDHCGHNHSHHDNGKRLIAALVVIAVFMVIETAGGFLAGSLALLADATHMLTDAFALALAASAHWLSKRPADCRLHFGYRRAQVLAAFLNGIALVGLLLWIGLEAIHRLFVPVDVNWQIMLGVAILGLAANIVAFVILNGAQSNDLNIRGALLHVVSDMLGSVAAVIAAGVIAFTAWSRIDPILSFLVAILIGRSAYRLIRETGHILLEGAPDNVDVETLVSGLKETAPSIRDVHHVRIWQLTPEHPRLTMHMCVDRADAASNALEKTKAYLEDRFGIRQSTIQVEIGGRCSECIDKSVEAVIGANDLSGVQSANSNQDPEPARGAVFASPTK